jgi:hypothetical protein
MAVTPIATAEWLNAQDVPEVGRHFFRFVSSLGD